MQMIIAIDKIGFRFNLDIICDIGNENKQTPIKDKKQTMIEL